MFIEVIVPGPWWHPLTYEFDESCIRGIRLIVPVRGLDRVAFATGLSGESPPSGHFRIQRAKRVLDNTPPLGWELFETAGRLGRHFLCGFGEALKAVAPGKIISGGEIKAFPEIKAPPAGNFREEFCDAPNFDDRARRYTELINCGTGRVLALFPEKETACFFWKNLPGDLREQSLCWTSNSGPAAMDNWERTRSGEVRVVVGSPAALFAPLPSIEAVIVDDEGNPSYRSRRFPFIHARIAAGSRAQLWGSRFVLGGGVPSSKSFFRNPRRCPESPGDRMIFVDIGKSRKIMVPGIQSPLPVSDSALKRTQAIVAEKKTALWILDRKGYAGGVTCDECGRIMICGSCGLPVRWDDSEGLFRCGFCGATRPRTEICPFCGGVSLQGLKAGLESLQKIGENVLGENCPVFTWHADIKQAASSRKAIVKKLSSGGLVVGSRKTLELCDHMAVDLVCWLDADSAVNSPFYDARSVAFRMIWESAWRGTGHSERTVLLQSRVPGTGWQKGLLIGWDHFWRVELDERKELDLPPWRFLLEIKNLGKNKPRARDLAVSSGLECLDPDPSGDILWVRCENLSVARKSLEPLFCISESGKGFPRISLWAD
ncbi:MAG: hypothetical protein Q7I97_05510 [Thermovirgaceae bacterium]|nr:hypothetical protein [Thermovirgaceae bacterium]